MKRTPAGPIPRLDRMAAPDPVQPPNVRGMAPALPVDGSSVDRSWSGPARLLLPFALLAVVVSALMLFGDTGQLATALSSFRWWFVAPILGLTLIGYLIRFLRWQVYLDRLHVPPLPVATSALVFLSGFSMAVTPAKAGEVIKCVELRRLTGAPVSRTGAIVLAERVTDVLAMLVLAAVGVGQFAYGRALLGAACLAAVAGVALLQRPALTARLVGKAAGWPLVGRFAGQATVFFQATGSLLRPRLLAGATALGVASWAMECVALFLVLIGLGVPATWHLLLVATLVMATATLLGAVSMLPGGLGVTDASVAGMLALLVPGDEMTRATAAAAALLIRFATLWFGVLLGLAALGLLHAGGWRAWRAPVRSPAGAGDP